MKPIQLPQITIEALLSGAEYIIVPCKIDLSYRENMNGINMLYPDYIKKFIEVHSPIQSNEEFYLDYLDNCNQCIWYTNGYCESSDTKVYFDSFEDCENITINQHQSRFKFKVLDVRVKRVQDIDAETSEEIRGEISKGFLFWDDVLNELLHLEDFYNKIAEHYKTPKYEDNPYVFLIKVKEIKW